jgi:hypothetical protein
VASLLTAVAALLVIVATVSTVAAIRLDSALGRTAEAERQARKREAEALASAAAERQARQKEVAERKKALVAHAKVVDELRATTDEALEALIGSRPALGPAEKAFLEKTLKRWRRFAAEWAEGELARALRAEGVYYVTVLRQKLGQIEGVAAGYEEAIALLESVREANFSRQFPCRNGLLAQTLSAKC